MTNGAAVMPGNDGLRERSLPELLHRLADQTALLVRQEIDLARTETIEKFAVYRAAAGMFGGAALLGLGAFGAFTAALIVALATVIPAWGAALLITIVYGVLAFVLLRRGQSIVGETTPLPTQTIETTKEDIEWAKTRAASAKR